MRKGWGGEERRRRNKREEVDANKTRIGRRHDFNGITVDRPASGSTQWEREAPLFPTRPIFWVVIREGRIVILDQMNIRGASAPLRLLFSSNYKNASTPTERDSTYVLHIQVFRGS